MAQTLLAHELVKQKIRSRLGRQWRAGARLPPIADLARRLGAGHNNTHRAVRELVDEGLLESRPGRGTHVRADAPVGDDGDAIRPALIPVLRGKRIVVLLGSALPFVALVADAVRDALTKHGCDVQPRRFNADDPDAFRNAPEPQAHALVVVNPNPRPPITFAPHQVLAVVNTALETVVAMPGRYDVVSVDCEQGGFLAGHRFRQIGCESACFIGVRSATADGFDDTSTMRLRGMEHALGGPVRPEHRLDVSSYLPDCGADVIPRWLALPDRPAGVFCASDDIAVGFVLGARAHGLVAGEDYQLIGFDGQERGRQILGGPLSTVEVPMKRMGRQAARMLAQRLAQPDQPVRRLFLGTTFFEGNTARRTGRDR